MSEDKQDIELLQRLGFEDWNTLQKKALRVIQKEKEVLLLSPTGSGKTIAFLRPLQALTKKTPGIQTLIIVPSRELAIQIEQVWKQMNTGYKVNCFYGGHDVHSELRSLQPPPALLIGTPGRLLDHLNRNSFDPSTIRTVVFDEFDKSLSLGFEDEMQRIMERLEKVQRKILVSATESIDIPDFVGLSDVAVIDNNERDISNNQLELKIVRSALKDKADTLFDLLCQIGGSSTIIFCNHREAAERAGTLLKEKGIENAVFHGGMEQMEREQTLIRFRNGSVFFLVATDLAARGLDIPEVRQIIHYHMPSTRAEFTHRNGRTARMEAEGTAYLILHEEEPIPDFVDGVPETLVIKGTGKLPPHPEWNTVFISGGKKDKIRKLDIVGFFGQAGRLDKSDIGMIDIRDYVSFAAIRRSKLKELLQRIAPEKMKGKKYRIAIAR
ncbi:MAG: DEAD/DEAH box helicase [Sphingobacteriales bacterium]|nr:MAG: DEAD/DEAH box helicase [Sphingobacteriales bacterium]